MTSKLFTPPEALAGHVAFFWTFEVGHEDVGSTLRTFASGGSGIIIQDPVGQSELSPGGTRAQSFTTDDAPTSLVYGKRTEPSLTFVTRPFGLTGVVFKPQALSALLDIQPAAVVNAPVSLADVSGGTVGETMLTARTQQERLVRLVRFLHTRVCGARPEDPLVAAGLRLIHRRIRSIRVPHVVTCLHVSERQFERRFLRAIGVSPHLYIRIVRFQEAVRLLKTEDFPRLSDVAHELRYADQSHFIKDVKAFAGHTPTRLAEIVHTCVDLPCGVSPARMFNEGLLDPAQHGLPVRRPARVTGHPATGARHPNSVFHNAAFRKTSERSGMTSARPDQSPSARWRPDRQVRDGDS
jgi:AraC-like DNA-binding protein